ncbi:MAG: EutN/CcmL family microcompartment protein [bacterium]|jgi:microcompartment protein CcmK/EutM|nr:EutN/CcmL family microcompartment protein [bacterium]
MFLARVVGTVVATQKDHKLEGLKLMIVRQFTIDLEPTNTFLVAADSVGAGKDEIVVCCTGSSARLTERTEGLPVDTVIMAIADSLEIEGKIIYKKS